MFVLPQTKSFMTIKSQWNLFPKLDPWSPDHLLKKKYLGADFCEIPMLLQCVSFSCYLMNLMSIFHRCFPIAAAAPSQVHEKFGRNCRALRAGSHGHHGQIAGDVTSLGIPMKQTCFFSTRARGSHGKPSCEEFGKFPKKNMETSLFHVVSCQWSISTRVIRSGTWRATGL